MKCMTIVGTRPEFVQVAPLTKALRKNHTEILVNTGQHYDDNMSKVFFTDLDLPQPEISLGIGSGSHAQQTGEMMIGLEKAMQDIQPDWVIVYGDTNSTVAAAIAAAKLHIPIAHVEAGLRSFDRQMPEEINRVLTDHISTVLFSPTDVAVTNLKNEGITEGVYNVGDVRIDVLRGIVDRARDKQIELFNQTKLSSGEPFALATIHRASNTDDKDRLSQIVASFGSLDMPIVLPIHPRLRKMMGEYGYQFNNNVRVIDPVGFLEMVALLDACKIVITDSGGLQKEAYMMYRPAVTVRDTTEWVETVDAGWNRLCEPEPKAFKAAVAAASAPPPAEHPDFYGAYSVSERMVGILEQRYAKA